MQTAGIVLDLYDNPSDLKTIFPSVDVIPDSVKVAHALSSEEREALPDDSFALVLLDGGERLRKYACVDEGNTVLNLAYFFKHGHKLPVEAQKTAAENLKVACAWYGLEVPEDLEKVALGLNTVMNAAMLPSIVKGTGGQIRDNLQATRVAGSRVISPHEQHQLSSMLKGAAAAPVEKDAELSGTSVMPNQDPGNLQSMGKRQVGTSNTAVMKTAAMNPYVDVTGKQAMRLEVDAQPEFSAYRGRYPLDSYTQVKTASQYFEENLPEMPPEMRHEFAVGLAKRAHALGIGLSDRCEAYGSETFAPEEQIKVALDTRRPFLTEKQAAVLDTLYSHRYTLGPVKFSETLEEFDKLAQIDWRYDASVLDPYASTFGTRKTASDEGDSWTSGNDYITKQQIENYAVTAFHTLKHDYGDDMAKEFKKDPWGIFSSLPVDQKRRIARAAGDNGATGMYDVQ